MKVRVLKDANLAFEIKARMVGEVVVDHSEYLVVDFGGEFPWAISRELVEVVSYE